MVTFGFAITAIPISGANCGDLCIEYPYLNTLSQFPKDYLWMPLAIILILSYLVLMPMDGEHKGRYQVGYVSKGSGTQLSRADGADFILKELTEKKWLKKLPVVSY